jgi:hypothetical protein
MDLQGTYNPQGGAGAYLQGSSPNLQGSPNTLQVTANPQTQNLTFGTPQGATDPTAPATTPYYDAAAAQAAADAAAKAAQANAIKGAITGITNNIRSVYDAIYGDLNVVGTDKTRSVNQKYNNENTALVDQYNTDFPAIGNAYAARGVYDSSYRQDSEAGANKQFTNMQGQLQTGRAEDLAKVGQWVDQQRAQVGADNATLGGLEALIAQSTDPDQLASYQQQITQKLADLTASRAGMRSQESYAQTANSLVDSTDQSAGLRGTLSAIVQGAAPAPLKRSTAMKLIQSSGLPPEQQQALVNDFDKQLSGTTDQPVDQTVVQGA